MTFIEHSCHLALAPVVSRPLPRHARLNDCSEADEGHRVEGDEDHMTLNISVATRALAVQTSDFRLTYAGTAQIRSSSAQKQVVLHYRDWSGLLCYTGIAEAGNHNTAEWLGRVLSHKPGNRSMKEVVDQIQSKGSVWLKRISASQRHHTFTLLAYSNQIPHIYTISNFQSLRGPDLPVPADQLFVSHVRIRGVECFVTGQKSATDEDEIADLADEMSRRRTPKALRAHAANVSRKAAMRSQDLVSESCVSSHMLPDGSGEAQVFGNIDDVFIPSLIVNGMDTAPVGPEALKQSGLPTKARMVGATWSKNNQAAVMLVALRPLANQVGSGWE
ncbi:hypothetical protein [Herbidospora cretacea]|uniref:hypothetical protein n=1 Tax=Herbidospora cretacea TaxID=28444 RepID=UPI000A50D87A|nr:hypothetical protein [Herbidospora cretacea]